MDEKREKLIALFKAVDEKQLAIIVSLIDEFLYLENHVLELRKLPILFVDPKDNQIQERLPAATLYREFSNKYVDINKKLIDIYHKSVVRAGGNDDDPLNDFMAALRS